jgi:hypothetical protein
MKKYARTVGVSLIASLGGLVFAAHANGGQQNTGTEKTPSSAELRARLAVLERDLAGMQRDYQLLLTAACQAPSSSSSANVDDALERARVAAAEQELHEDNDRVYREQTQMLEDANWYVKDVTYRVTQQNQAYVRFGWKLTVYNGTSKRQTYDVDVQFLDDRGFVVDTAHVFRQHVAAYHQQTHNDSFLIAVPSALNVRTIQAIAKRRPDAR